MAWPCLSWYSNDEIGLFRRLERSSCRIAITNESKDKGISDEMNPIFSNFVKCKDNVSVSGIGSLSFIPGTLTFD